MFFRRIPHSRILPKYELGNLTREEVDELLEMSENQYHTTFGKKLNKLIKNHLGDPTE